MVSIHLGSHDLHGVFVMVSIHLGFTSLTLVSMISMASMSWFPFTVVPISCNGYHDLHGHISTDLPNYLSIFNPSQRLTIDTVQKRAIGGLHSLFDMPT